MLHRSLSYLKTFMSILLAASRSPSTWSNIQRICLLFLMKLASDLAYGSCLAVRRKDQSSRILEGGVFCPAGKIRAELARDEVAAPLICGCVLQRWSTNLLLCGAGRMVLLSCAALGDAEALARRFNRRSMYSFASLHLFAGMVIIVR